METHYERQGDAHGFTVFLENGGWCWYQDPRALLSGDKVVVGGIEGNGDGSAVIAVYGLKERKILARMVVHEQFDRDDHNSPVIRVRPDGSLLAVYARHGTEKVHYYRISDTRDTPQWSDELKLDHAAALPHDKVTYMNLIHLSAEDKLYNFFRGFQWNPSFVTSTDAGLTWGEPAHFIKNEVEGQHRPYARYAANGADTVHVSFTDAHPRNFGNGIYYAAFRSGSFYKADGTLIKELEPGGPLSPGEAELVYRGSLTKDKPEGFESVPGAAWTSAIEVTAENRPHIGYTLYLSNDDHRYRLASWTGARWIDREIAYGGKCLYPAESSYTGLVTMDPVDPTVVFISTDVDPSTGKDLGGEHEIYRARVGPADDLSTIEWQAVTEQSPVRNIRPLILRDGNRRVVLWNRGRYNSYMDYDLDTVGFVERVDSAD